SGQCGNRLNVMAAKASWAITPVNTTRAIINFFMLPISNGVGPLRLSCESPSYRLFAYALDEREPRRRGTSWTSAAVAKCRPHGGGVRLERDDFHGRR